MGISGELPKSNNLWVEYKFVYSALIFFSYVESFLLLDVAMAGASGGLVGKGALLLQDVWGEKANSTITKIIGLGKKGSVNVLKGTLLCSIPDKEQVPRQDGKPAHNYRVYKNDVVTLFCSEQEVAPLTNNEFHLLNAIKSPGARFEVFVNGVADWGSKLKLNDMVYVTLPSKQAIGNQRVRAAVRWIGVLPNEDGIKFGVEITVCVIILPAMCVRIITYFCVSI